MSRELILHIGTTKTGSTSIQSVLDSKARELLAQGVYWPTTHGVKRHLLLALANSSNLRFHRMIGNPLWQGMKPAARITAYLNEFKEEMQELPSQIHKVIVSAEQFSEMLRDKSEINQLHTMLSPHFTKMTVVIYLRRQDSHYASMYAQKLRMGNLHEPSLASVRVGFNHDYDYYDVLTRWSDVFGADAVQPRLFGQMTAKKFDVVDDFLACCGVKLALTADDHKRARNPSMNLVGQRALLKAGELLAQGDGENVSGSVLWNRVATSVTRVAAGTGWLPTQGEAQAFLTRFEKSNEAVRERWFPQRDKLFDDDLTKLPDHAVPPDYEAGFGTACAALLDAADMALKREQTMLLQIARLAEAAGDHRRMQAALVQVISLDSRNISARLQLAEYHFNKGKKEKAQGIFEVAVGIAPLHPGVQRLALLLSKHDVDEPLDRESVKQ